MLWGGRSPEPGPGWTPLASLPQSLPDSPQHTLLGTFSGSGRARRMGWRVLLGARRGNGEGQGKAERPPCWLPASAWPCDVDLGQAWLVKRVPSCSGLCAGKGQTQVPPVLPSALAGCAVTLVLTTLGFMPLPCGQHWPGLGRVGLGLSVAGQPGVFSAFSWTQPAPSPGTRPLLLLEYDPCFAVV